MLSSLPFQYLTCQMEGKTILFRYLNIDPLLYFLIQLHGGIYYQPSVRRMPNIGRLVFYVPKVKVHNLQNLVWNPYLSS